MSKITKVDAETKFRKQMFKLTKDILISLETIKQGINYIRDDIKRQRG